MKDTTMIAGLRFQYYPATKGGIEEVHVHDDDKKLKFRAVAKDFKKDLQNALKEFKKDDGAIAIGGLSSDDLYLVKEGKILRTFVGSKSDVTKDLENFINTL